LDKTILPGRGVQDDRQTGAQEKVGARFQFGKPIVGWNYRKVEYNRNHFQLEVISACQLEAEVHLKEKPGALPGFD
jgi:hypothetical protein